MMTELLDPETLQPIQNIEQKFQEIVNQPQDDIPAPRRMTPERKEELATAPKRTRSTRASKDKPKTVKAAPRASTPAVDAERAESVADTMNLAAGGLLMAYAANKDKNPPLATALAADAVTLTSAADEFGKACASVAKQSPGFARLIDGTGKAGPWFAFSTAIFAIGSQVAVNHGVLPAGMLGTVAPESLAAMVGNENGPDANS